MPPPPLHIQSQLKQAFDSLNAGRFDEARRVGSAILKSMPKEPNALYLMGVLHHRNGDLKEAARYFEKSHNADRTNAAALSGMGIVRIDQQRFGEAVKIFEDLRRKMPREPVVLNNLGIAYKGLQRFDAAIPAFESALSVQPNYAEAYANLGGLLTSLGETGRALEILKRGLQRCPGDASIRLNLADALNSEGDLNGALAVLREAVQAVPGDRELRLRLASILVNKGAFDEARGLLKALIAENGDDPTAWFDYADLVEARPDGGDLSPSDYRAKGLAAFWLQGPSTDAPPILAQRIAQACEAEGDYDAAFRFYSRAQSAFKAGLRSVGKEYDRSGTASLYDSLMDVFRDWPPPDTAEFPADSARGSRRPIFIVGMPRSGTSLLEQVLASHSKIAGAGELMDIPRLISDRLPADGDLARMVAGLTDSELEAMAAAYLEALDGVDANARHVTDKLPVNFVNVGLIRRLFPNALILNTERHPLDVSWSIYVQKFGSDLLFDHDLSDIGHYYRQYDRLMRFWRDWDSAIVPVRYESMVSDMDATVMPVLDRLGLDWDPAMAKFFETDRDVLTASRLQVRRPIYKSSVARWKRFDGKLGPLLSELGDLPDRYEESL